MSLDEKTRQDLERFHEEIAASGLTLDGVRALVAGSRRDGTRDLLTGLPNRAAFDERLQREVGRAGRYGAELSLVLLDLDDFAGINERVGHDAADAVLCDFARLLVGLRDGDECFRIGADQFALVLPETDAAGAAVVAERVASAPIAKGRISLSYGIAEFAAGPAEDLLRSAELALIAAKRARKAPRLSVA
jgi:diguanylate cyclase (GGDEF)-like protein